MAASTEFSRTLSLLRQERGVSQRTAAADLGISQALLSHYENGIREPGLAFVVKACDYYHVSADFILGRTLSREGNMLTEQEILNAAEPGNILQGSVLATLQSKLLSGAIGVLFGLLGKLNDKGAINAAAGYLGSAVYQLYRHLYRTAGANEAYFALDPAACTMGTAEADMKLSEIQYTRSLRAQAAKKAAFPDLSNEALTAAYPGRCQSLTQVLSHSGRPSQRPDGEEQMSFQSLGFLAFLAVTLAVCLPVGRRSPRGGAALLTIASAVFYLLGPGGWTVVLGGLVCLLLGIAVTAWALRRMGRAGADRRRTLALACVYHIAVLVGFKYAGVPHRRRGGGGLGASGPELLHLPAAVAAEGGLHRGIHSKIWGPACCSTACFFPLSPPALSCGRTPSSPAAGRELPPAGLGRRGGGVLRHLLRHHQEGAAGGRLRHRGEQRLGPSGGAERPGGLAGDPGLH